MNTPRDVKIAAIAWSMAVAAGAIESVLAVGQLAAQGELDGGAWLGIGIRVVVYVIAIALTVGLAHGRRLARIGLTAVLSVIGLASMVVPAVLALLAGQTLFEALSDGGALGWAFVLTRSAHIVLVVVATMAMFTPAANGYFARTHRASQPRSAQSSRPRSGSLNR